MSTRTVVHLLRHGEVDNPRRILYGRLPGFHLSDLGRQMADRARDYLLRRSVDRDVVRVVSSPMERAQQTAQPLAGALGLPVHIDGRLIEAASVFEGQGVGPGDGVLRSPAAWRHLYNPFRPSWGEPYALVGLRMRAALAAARDAAPGRASVLVSHQMPIWVARRQAEGRRLWHDPRRRQCALASVTSFHYDDDELVLVTYAEPAADLLPVAVKVPGA